MLVCVVGSGAREHALAQVLGRDAEVVVTPGNPGIEGSTDAPPLEIDADLYVIGPEAPLVDGLADRLRAQGRAVFGPGADGAQLEGSKAWMKALLVEAGVATARHGTFTDAEPALAYLDTMAPPYVVKTDGLAAGKGVIVTDSLNEARNAIGDYLAGVAFGDAGRTVVIEEGLAGPELSVLAVCDGQRSVLLAPAQDFKRVGAGDTGPNTGGMGAYSPAPVVTPEVHARVMREVIQPVVDGMEAEGAPFSGFLYAGLMIAPDGSIKTLEFNCRMGDPETQPILMRLKSDLVEVLLQATDGTLDQARLDWDRRVALGVVVAAAGYPMNPRKGDAIDGLPAAAEDLKVFHAGTTRQDGRLLSSGGRVLCVTALGDKTSLAQARAYEALQGLRLDGAQFRTDIGHRAIKR